MSTQLFIGHASSLYKQKNCFCIFKPIYCTSYNNLKKRGTGMIASSSTFHPHPGRVIVDLFRLLDALYGIVRKH